MQFITCKRLPQLLTWSQDDSGPWTTCDDRSHDERADNSDAGTRSDKFRVPVFYLTRVGFRLGFSSPRISALRFPEHPAGEAIAQPSGTVEPNLLPVHLDRHALMRFHFRRAFARDIGPDKRRWHRHQASILAAKLGRQAYFSQPKGKRSWPQRSARYALKPRNRTPQPT